MSDERDGYQAYLLRLWRVRCQGKWQWRASLESPATSERQVFAGLGQMFTFLYERCDSQVDTKTEEAPEEQAHSGFAP